MVGITRIGAYFPRRRLDRALIAKAWGVRVPPGARTVAGFDEDALTMATDAVLACLGDADPAGFDALYFASTSSPYLEKQVASMIATAADLRRDIVVADLAGSVRAGLAALRAALAGGRAGRLGAALRKAELPPARVARLVLGAPEPRAAAEAARRAGFDPARQLEASLLAEAGLLGTPEPLALLARALETAAPGDFLVVGGYGE